MPSQRTPTIPRYLECQTALTDKARALTHGPGTTCKVPRYTARTGDFGRLPTKEAFELVSAASRADQTNGR